MATALQTPGVPMEADWIRPAGRREDPGCPLTYATTTGFPTHFAPSSRRHLPGIDDLRGAVLLEPVDPAFENAVENDDDRD